MDSLWRCRKAEHLPEEGLKPPRTGRLEGSTEGNHEVGFQLIKERKEILSALANGFLGPTQLLQRLLESRKNGRIRYSLVDVRSGGRRDNLARRSWTSLDGSPYAAGSVAAREGQAPPQ
jgi:hypothetical protein